MKPAPRLARGWLAHLAALILLGFYQQGYRDFLDTVFNAPLMWLVHALHGPWLDRLMIAASQPGKGGWVGLAFLLLAGAAWRWRDRRDLALVAAVMLGTALLSGLGKTVIHTARPHLWTALEHASGSSFPSSHTSGSLSIALAAWLLLPARWRLPLGLPLFGMAFLTGLSRVYLGVHAPTDILLTWLWVGSWAAWSLRCLPATAR